METEDDDQRIGLADVALTDRVSNKDGNNGAVKMTDVMFLTSDMNSF